MILRVAGDIVNGLKGSPVLIAILVLNLAFIGAALYFAIRYGEVNAARLELILKSCLPKGATL